MRLLPAPSLSLSAHKEAIWRRGEEPGYSNVYTYYVYTYTHTYVYAHHHIMHVL